MHRLTSDERAELPARLPDWTLDGDTLARTVRCRDFATALGFVVAVGTRAERADHHPDIDIRWNTVTLRLTTHDAGGLTDRDVALAAQIDELAPTFAADN